MRLLTPAVLLAVLASCSGREDPVNEAAPESEVPIPPVLPVLEVTAPARASWFADGFDVVGSGSAGDAALDALTLNSEDRELGSDGSFSIAHTAAPGIAVVGTRLTDVDGERAVDGRGVHVGPVRAPGEVIANAIGLHMHDSLLDDDSPDMDDFAGVMEAVIESPGFGAFLAAGPPIEQGGVTITIEDFSVDYADVDILPYDGKLEIDIYMYGVESDFHATGSLVDTDGQMTMDELVMNMDVTIANNSSGIVVDVPFAYASIDGFEWSADDFPSWMTDVLADTVQYSIEQSLENKSKELVGDLLGDTLSSFAVDLTFADGEIDLSMALASVEVISDGLVLWMDGSVEAAIGMTLPEGAGSLTTPGAPPDLPLSGARPFNVVIDDDFINQALFAFWHSGALTGWSFLGLELQLMTGEPLAPPLGPVDRAIMGLQLPPVLTVPVDGVGVDVSMGEFWFQITREDGEQIDASLNLRIAGELVTTDDGISIQLDNRPAKVLVHAGIMEAPATLDPGDLASLFRLATPTLMGKASSAFPSFPAPAIPLGEFIDVDALDGVEWNLADLEHEMREDGWVVLRGGVTTD